MTDGLLYRTQKSWRQHRLEADGFWKPMASPTRDGLKGRGAADAAPPTDFCQNFGNIVLGFACIGTDLCKSIRVFQHFLRSTWILQDYLAEF